MGYGIVYKFTNKKNGKCYVGVTRKTLEERLNAHLNKANHEKSAFQRALKKYGKESFSSCVIDNASSEKELFEKETFWIKFYNTMAPLGYNLTTGGGGIVNMTAEIRKKISITKTGVKNPKLKGRIISEKQREMISITLGGSKVLATDKSTGSVIVLKTVRDGLNYGFNPSLISAVLHGKRKSHKNFTFSRISDANTEITLECKNSKAS